MAGFSEHATVVGYCVVSHSLTLNLASGKGVWRVVAAVEDDCKLISLAWLMGVANLKYATPRSFRVLGSKLWQHQRCSRHVG